jgi:predicted lipoprotein with Yx(FWY)xxD motif
MFRFARSSSLLAATAVAIIVAGCAQSGSGGATPTPAGSTGATASQAANASGAVYTINLQQSNLGAYLTGEDGKSLYVFAKDTANTSNCTSAGGCMATWPPFTLDPGESAVAGTGVTGTVSTIQRSDGSTQVAINGHPVYYFSGDAAAGQTNGQGFKGIWYLAAADGSPLQGAAASSGYGY